MVLNGAPRSGKSSIATAIRDGFDGPWMNLGVDVFARSMTPERFRPGIGLRPDGERPDLEVDTSVLSPTECAETIQRRIREGPSPTALAQLASREGFS